MRKIFLFVLLFFISYSFVNAESNFENDYTLIDCINWDNSSWIAFDNSKPFSTLKVWIEKTIKYINSNINLAWNEQNASWKVFHIKVNCSFLDVLNPVINLNYFWENFKNELIIEWIWENSLIFKDSTFQLSPNTWNITFKNAIFMNEYKPYFFDDMLDSDVRNWGIPFSNWIKIKNSYIKLKNSNNIWLYWTYRNVRYINRNWMIDYDYYQNYTNKQIIENSTIDIEIWGDFNFRMPVSIKNSKINFTNSGSNSNYNITFLEDWNTRINTDLNYSVLTSNEIDLWWNNFLTEDNTNITFLNNKFLNFGTFNFSGNWIYINNFIDNNQSIDISNFKNLYNNILKSWFTDSYDIFNYRKNYSFNNIWNTWIGWIYKRIRSNKYFDLDITSAWLYKEITGQDLPSGLWDIYVIFNY
jgi:hypothetical protein